MGNMLALASGSIISQAVTLVASIILAKLYTPDEMGIYTNYISILNVISVFVCLQYDRALILPDKKQDAQHVLRLCVSVAITISALCALILLPFHTWIASRMNSPALAPWLCLLPFSVLLSGVFSTFQFWNSRRKTLSNVALAHTTQTIVSSGSQIFLGLAPIHLYGGMILGNFIGHLFSTALLLKKTIREKSDFFPSGTNREGVRRVAIRYWKFFATIPGAFFDNMGASLPPLMLTYFFGDAASGFYSLGHRILALPLSVVGNSVSQAFLPEAKEAYRCGTLRFLCLRVMNLLLQVSCVPFLLLALVAPALISFIFGARWYAAGGYIKWMSAWLLIQFVYSSLSCIFTILERQQTYTVLNFFTLCIRFLSLVAGGIILKNPLAAIALCSLSGAAVSGFKCAYILHLAGVHPGETFSCFVRQLLHALLYAIPTLISLALIGQNMFSAVVAILSGCVFLLLEMKPILHSLQTIGNDKTN